MPVVTILPAGRRSCEENRARRAWASAHNRRPNNLLHLLGNLLPLLVSPRPVYGRVARQALASGDAEQLLDALKMVCREIEVCRTDRAKYLAFATRLSTQAA